MDATELKNFSVDELNGRVLQWREELFRSKFKTQSAEKKDTSVLRKLRRDIARGLTILNQKLAAGEVGTKAPAKEPKEAKVAKAPKVKAAKVAAPEETSEKVLEDKPATEKPAKKGKKPQEGKKK